MATLNSSYQLVATVTSSALGSNYGCRLYLKYSGSTVYYEVRYYGYQSMAYNSLSGYIKYADGSTRIDLSGACNGGSTSSNAEWVWRSGSWNVSNSGSAYSESLIFDVYGCPSKDGARGNVTFTYEVPAQGVLNPVPEVRFTRKAYELDNVVTIEWDKADGVTPDAYDVYLFRNNTQSDSDQYARVSNTTFRYTFPIALCNNGYQEGDYVVALVRSWSGSTAKDRYNYTFPHVVSACPVYISINGGEFKKLDTGVIKM